MRKRHLLSAAAVVVVLGFLDAPIAAANHWDSIFDTVTTGPDCTGGSVCLADNTTHTVYVEDLGTNLKPATKWTLANYNNTDLTIVYETTPDLSGGSETDAVYQRDDTLPGTLLGSVACDDPLPGLSARCDQFYVSYDGAYANYLFGSYTTGNTNGWRELACHESGHAVGLLHGQDAFPRQDNQTMSLHCMQTPLDPNNTDPTIGEHNSLLINDEV